MNKKEKPMTNHFGPISREDYEEPNCVLCMDKDRPAPIPQRRVREKLDEYMSRRDYAGAERHLNYWLAEAQQNGDKRGEFFVRGEMMGHYRKIGNREQAILNANESLNLIDQLGFEGTLSAGTAYVNAATVYDAFGMLERSIELFEKGDYMAKIHRIEEITRREMAGFSDPRVKEVRIMGGCVCIEVYNGADIEGFRRFARERGVFSRTFLKYMYAMVPYVIEEWELVKILTVMKEWFAR